MTEIDLFSFIFSTQKVSTEFMDEWNKTEKAREVLLKAAEAVTSNIINEKVQMLLKHNSVSSPVKWELVCRLDTDQAKRLNKKEVIQALKLVFTDFSNIIEKLPDYAGDEDLEIVYGIASDNKSVITAKTQEGKNLALKWINLAGRIPAPVIIEMNGRKKPLKFSQLDEISHFSKNVAVVEGRIFELNILTPHLKIESFNTSTGKNTQGRQINISDEQLNQVQEYFGKPDLIFQFKIIEETKTTYVKSNTTVTYSSLDSFDLIQEGLLTA